MKKKAQGIAEASHVDQTGNEIQIEIGIIAAEKETIAQTYRCTEKIQISGKKAVGPCITNDIGRESSEDCGIEAGDNAPFRFISIRDKPLKTAFSKKGFVFSGRCCRTCSNNCCSPRKRP